MLRRLFLTVLLAATLPGAAASAADRFIIVQSTTSTEQSGLFGHILPLFEEKTGIEVRVVAVGTGQAIKNARNGDGDVLFVHSKPDEERFVAEGFRHYGANAPSDSFRPTGWTDYKRTPRQWEQWGERMIASTASVGTPDVRPSAAAVKPDRSP